MMLGIGECDDEKLLRMIALSGKLSDYLHGVFERAEAPMEPMLFTLAMLLIEGSQDQTKFTRETFLEWMGKQWDAMAKDGLN
jgi:hypothetical protein